MTRSPRLTIGLPVYNGARFVGEAIESILGQSFGDFEILVSDNASTDATESIVKAFAERDPRIHYHRNPVNIGLTRNFNQVFRSARGDLFKWAAADDALGPGWIERCIAVLDADPGIVLACTRAQFVDAEGRLQPVEDRTWDLMMDEPRERARYVIYAGHWVNSILGIIRTSALRRTALLPDYPDGDFTLLTDLALQGKFRQLAEPLYRRRLHPEASSQIRKDDGRIAAYIAGENGRRRPPAWSRTLDTLAVVWRSRQPFTGKLALSGAVAGSMRYRRARLWREMLHGMTPHSRRAS